MCAGEATTTDGQLLRAFAEEKDDAAFGEVVRRHGAMVQRVCRNLLRDGHESEDAAQAVFLTLAKKSGSLTGNASVAAWLHHVARCVCINTCQANAARLARERKAAEMSAVGTADGTEREELRYALSNEMDALPGRYREALILFHLEERSLEQTAQALGCPVKTVSTRLCRAREMLRKRFVRRGMVLSLTAVGSLLSAEAGAAVLPEGFVGATVKAASLFVADGAGGVATGSATAAILAKGAMKAMLITQIKVAAIAAVGVAVVGAGIGTTAHYAMAKETLVSTQIAVVSDDGTNTVSEREALVRSLDWLARNQEADGNWNVGGRSAVLTRHSGDTNRLAAEAGRLLVTATNAESVLRVGQQLMGNASSLLAQSTTVRDSGESQELRDKAMDSFETAALVYECFAVRFPSHPLTGKTQVIAGQCYMRAEKYSDAVKAFGVIINRSVDGEPDTVAEALFWCGESYMKTGSDEAEAYKVFKRMTWDYPRSKWTKYARGRLVEPRLQEIASRGDASKPLETNAAGNRHGVTGLAVLALIRGGHARGTSLYDDNVNRGLVWIAGQTDAKTGLIGSNLYEHAICTLALCEGAGPSRSAEVNAAARQAVSACVAAEAKTGGWRYVPGASDGDVSMTCWHLQALFAAKKNGMVVDAGAIARAMAFVDSCTENGAKEGSSGSVGYTVAPTNESVAGPRYPSLTCAGIMVRCLNGTDPESPLLVGAADLAKKGMTTKWMEKDFYYRYYATHAMATVGGGYWTDCMKEVSRHLLRRQCAAGPQTGSWDPLGERWNGGRTYCTSLGALCLEVAVRKASE